MPLEPAPEFEWPRFVVPSNGTITYGPDGYVIDPLGPAGRALNANMVPVMDIHVTPSLAILGEPGIGKSTVMRAMFDASPGPKMIRDLRVYATDHHLIADVFESDEFKHWLTTDDVLHVFLDGLDECLAHLRPAAALLADRLTRYPVSRLRLRIASRSGDWPALLESAMQRMWRDAYRSFELAPLREIDVKNAAKASGLSSDAFMGAVRARGVQSFAARPLTLRFLLNVFRSQGALPNSPVELYDQGCLYLAAESSPSRRAAGLRGRLTPRERVDIAALLAAVGILGKASGIRTPSASEVGERLADVVETGSVVAVFGAIDPRRPITADACEEVLKTALFSWRNDSVAVWAHWTYAEFLAGRFLGTNLSSKQLTSLFMRRGQSGRLQAVPQVREVIAWASAANPRFRDVLTAEDPLALAQSTVAGLDEVGKRALVASLLEAFARGEALDVKPDRPPRYELLCHSGIVPQVVPYIRDGGINLDARLAAVELAQECDVHDVVPDLAARALDKTEDMRIREAAARALSSMSQPGAAAALRPLLSTSPSEDPLDQLRGAALRGLTRAGLLGDEVWDYLTPPRRKSYFGSYAMFLTYELPKKLPDMDLKVALRFALAHTESDRSADITTRSLVSKILHEAWRRRADTGILAALADVVWRRMKNYDPPLGRDADDDEEGIAKDPTHRRQLLKAVVERAVASGAGTRDILASVFRWIGPEDFQWALEQATIANGATCRTWAGLARLVFRPSVESLELLYRALAQSAAVAEELRALVAPVDLDSPEAKEARAQYMQIAAFEKEREEERPPPFPPIASELLQKFESGTVDAFWHLNYAMAGWVGSDNRSVNEFESDLREYPAWTTLDDSLKVRIRDAGARYLTVGEPNTGEWIGTTTLHRPAAAGYRALALLHHERDARLESLPAELWAKWAGIIAAYPAEQDGIQAELGRLAYRSAPNQFTNAVLRVAENEDRQHGSVFVLLRFRELVDARFASALFRWLLDRQRKPGTVREVLDVVLPHICDAAERALAIVKETSREAALRSAAAEALLRFSTSQYWAVLWPDLVRDDEVLTRVLARLVEWAPSKRTGGFLAELTEDELAALHDWLAKKFPEGSDPDRSDGAHWVSDVDRLSQLRDSTLNQLKSRGTAKAVEILAALAAKAGPRSWLRYLVFEADEARLRENWRGLKPRELAALLARNETRVVDSDEELLVVTVEALQRLQSRLHGETPAAEDLWDKDRPKDELALSDYVKRFLADDLKGRSVVVNREVQVNRGSRTDVRVEAALGSERTVAVVVEVKGCWHRELMTAIRTQLVEQYLAESARRCGVYLVAWFVADRWSNDDPRKRNVPDASIQDVRRVLEDQAAALRKDGFDIAVVVLDATAVPKR